MIASIIDGFVEGWRQAERMPLAQCHQEEKEIREHLTEDQIDEMIEDSFPASDPPSTY